jgi:succinate dehydrogenase/fumarate reductase flavoprotein subunit
LIKGEIARISHGCVGTLCQAKLKSIGKPNTLLYFVLYEAADFDGWRDEARLTTPGHDPRWDDEVDLLVIGGGAAGMTAALVGSIEGLRTMLCEKTEMVGGTTATSAGTVWIPGSSQSSRAGIPDSVEAAKDYLRAVIGTEAQDQRLAAFLASGPAALDYLEARTDVTFIPASAHPDYQKQPGAAFGGRALGTAPFDGRRLGADFDRVRPPRPEFLVLGGMMVGRADIPFLLAPFASTKAFLHAAGMVARQAMDRLRHKRGTRLIMGNALVARLLYSLRRRNVGIRFETQMTDLVMEGGRVIGAKLATPHGQRATRAERGVILATGGIAWNAELRARLFPEPARQFSLAPPANTGDGIVAAIQSGAGLEQDMQSPALWMPCSVLRRPDRTSSVFPHIVLDRAKPGLIAVNSTGRRFVNEACSYHDFVVAMLRSNEVAPSVPAHLICDRGFIRDYGIGLVHPGKRDLGSFVKAGYLIEGDTIAALAQRIGVDPESLQRTIANHNRLAEAGVDEEFGRGSSDLNRINGDPDNKPNPCLRKIGPGPYYAVAVWPADLASSAGLRTDENGSVLDQQGRSIEGLYAVGNDAASVFRGTYPGPGTMLGPAIVFGWRAAMHAANHPSLAENAPWRPTSSERRR